MDSHVRVAAPAPLRRLHVYSDARGRIVDYLGSHEHLAVDIDLWVDDAGGLRLRSGAQRFYECAIGFSFPMLFSGIADVREWYDDAARRFRIEVDVHNRVWGPLFGYRGSFDVQWRKVVAGEVPGHVMPHAPGAAGLAVRPVNSGAVSGGHSGRLTTTAISVSMVRVPVMLVFVVVVGMLRAAEVVLVDDTSPMSRPRSAPAS